MPINSVVIDDVAQVGLSAWNVRPFLQKVTEIVPSVIYVFNHLENSNQYSNHSLWRTLGYSSEEVQEMGDRLMPTLIHTEDFPKVLAHFGVIKALSDGEIAKLEYRIKSKSGEWVWLLSHDTVFDRDDDGVVTHHIGVAADITAQKHAEEEARLAQQATMSTNEELRAFAYAMSHDMKAPANTLNLLLAELQATMGPDACPDQAELVDLAMTTVTRMGGLIEDVLNYTRMIGDPTAMEDVYLTDLVSGIVSTLHAAARRADAKILVNVPVTVRGDAMQLWILLQNLIENALKFRRPDTTCRIEITAEVDATKETALITVRDNGIGIPEDKQEEVFTIFKRLNPAESYAGTGLGLAVCRRIAANHATDITITSQPG